MLVAPTPKINEILKRRVGKGVVIDQETRWGSTYLMIQRLLEIKDSLVDMAHPDISMTESQWKQVEELETLLRLLYLVTKKLQVADLTPGLFYKQWKGLIFTLSKADCMIADAIKSSMMHREKILNLLLAAIYVDSMHCITLSNEQIDQGKAALCGLAV